MTGVPLCGDRKPLRFKGKSLFWNPYAIDVSVTLLMILRRLRCGRDNGPQLSRY